MVKSNYLKLVPVYVTLSWPIYQSFTAFYKCLKQFEVNCFELAIKLNCIMIYQFLVFWSSQVEPPNEISISELAESLLNHLSKCLWRGSYLKLSKFHLFFHKYMYQFLGIIRTRCTINFFGPNFLELIVNMICWYFKTR